MKTNYLFRLLFLFVILVLASCQKDDNQIILDNQEIVPENVLEQISALGYSTVGVVPIETYENGMGYLVEGDIILHPNNLNFEPDQGTYLRIAEEEQYSTTYTPEFNARTYNGVLYKEELIIALDESLPNHYINALQRAANRYNALNLDFKVVARWEGDLVRNLRDITVRPTNQGLASAGFPIVEETTVTSCPRGQGCQTVTRTTITAYNEILINPAAVNSNDIDYIATILAHETGHCIGFRHTDYFNRRLSCGIEYFPNGTPTTGNEDVDFPNTEGAVHIPGTPTGEDENSFMLACIDHNENRPFTNNDQTALIYLHGL